MSPKDGAYSDALRELAGYVQRQIYEHEHFPLRDREEALVGLQTRLSNIALDGPDGKREWRQGCMVLAAYAIFALVSDE